MKIGKRIIGFMAGALLSFSGIAQEATATLDSAEMLIGDQVPLHLSFRAGEQAEVLWPYRKDTVTEKIEIINQSEVDSAVTDSGGFHLTQKLVITSFDTGYLAIPPFEFAYMQNEDTAVVKTDPLLLHVKPMEVDTAQPIKVIKGPMEAPMTFAEVLPWILSFVGLALLALLIWYILKRRKEQKPVFPVREKPREPEDTEALKALEMLQNKKLWQKGHVKAYYSELSYIIRVYAERRYEVPAVESTSVEILTYLRKAGVERAEIRRLEELFEVADMAKFARLEPLPSENDRAMNDAVTFVENTRLPDAQESAKEESAEEKGGAHVE